MYYLQLVDGSLNFSLCERTSYLLQSFFIKMNTKHFCCNIENWERAIVLRVLLEFRPTFSPRNRRGSSMQYWWNYVLTFVPIFCNIYVLYHYFFKLINVHLGHLGYRIVLHEKIRILNYSAGWIMITCFEIRKM